MVLISGLRNIHNWSKTMTNKTKNTNEIEPQVSSSHEKSALPLIFLSFIILLESVFRSIYPFILPYFDYPFSTLILIKFVSYGFKILSFGLIVWVSVEFIKKIEHRILIIILFAVAWIFVPSILMFLFLNGFIPYTY